MDLPIPDALIEEQIEYYRARAPEYDDWWLRTGQVTGDDEFLARWERGKDELERALGTFAPVGDVLEIAAGTGNLTAWLVRHDAITSITAIDASTETMAIAATKIDGDKRVTFEQANVFEWRPPRRYDVIAFGFWLSHVPPGRIASFWSRVDDALAENGRVFLMDNAVPVEQAASAHGRHTSSAWSQTWLDKSVSVRTLSDGRQFHIVKRLWTPPELEAELAEFGWSATALEHEGLFISAEVTRR